MISFNSNLVYIIVIPLIIGIISFVAIDYVFIKSNQSNCTLNIFIAILSERKNLEKRQTLRQTWIQTIYNINANNSLIKSNYDFCEIKLNAKFIIGDKDCPIAPVYRLEPYSCTYNHVQLTKSKAQTYLQQFKAIKEQTISHKRVFRGFSFVIRHSVVVTQLGIHQNFLDFDQNITIILLNAQNKEFIKTKNISINSFKLNEVYYEDIEPLVLPKDFYGLLVIDNQLFEFNHEFGSVVTLNQNGFFHILRAYYGFSDYESIPYKSDLIIGPTLVYKPIDRNAIELLIGSQNEIQFKWNNELLKVKERLLQEIVDNNDIILIDSIDIYRNLSEKLIQSLRFSINSHKLTHFLKTDDDCYLNVINIVNHLIENISMKKVWFGNFRRLWPLDYWGKWAENDYESPLYPTFACGSGYVLTADLVQSIVSISNHLHRFQGEDVSLGIWLSAIKPHYNDDKRWVCNRSDANFSQTFSFPQLEEKEIIKIHNFIINDKK